MVGLLRHGLTPVLLDVEQPADFLGRLVHLLANAGGYVPALVRTAMTDQAATRFQIDRVMVAVFPRMALVMIHRLIPSLLRLCQNRRPKSSECATIEDQIV